MNDTPPAVDQTARLATSAPSSLPGPFRAVVFDMDGLLLDSEGAWQAAEEQLLASHGATLTEADRLASLGRSIDEVIVWYTDRVGWPPERAPELREELLSLVREQYASSVTMPGARELIGRLRGRVRLGLASNTPRVLVEHALTAAGLRDAFDAVVTASDVATPKPAPDLYRLVCERLGVAPWEAVALEDSETGVAAAKAAGMACIAVPQMEGLDMSAADRVVDSLERPLEP